MKDCEMTRDLMTLYADGLASPESEAFIARHIEGCPDCRAALERMRERVEPAETPAEADYRKTLQSQKKRRAWHFRLATVLALLVGVGACLLLLWSRGVFYIADRQVSPDGRTTATAYTRNISGPFPTKEGFSIVQTGHFRGTTSYLDAEFTQMAWSVDGRYLMVAMETSTGPCMEVGDHLRNSGLHMCPHFGSAARGSEELAAVGYEELEYGEHGQGSIRCRFVQWHEEDDDLMLVAFSFTDRAGEDHSGYFWYDCSKSIFEDDKITGVVEIPMEFKKCPDS